MQTEEKWMSIQDYEGLYEISNFGQVKSLDREFTSISKGKFCVKRWKGRILKPKYRKDGYVNITLAKHGINKVLFVHRLVGQAFIENPENKPEINHIDGIKTNLFVGNLEWSTKSENKKHAFDTGLKKPVRLGKHGNAKIILDTQTGIFYDCIKEAASAKGMAYKTLMNKLHGWNKNKINNTGLIQV